MDKQKKEEHPAWQVEFAEKLMQDNPDKPAEVLKVLHQLNYMNEQLANITKMSEQLHLDVEDLKEQEKYDQAVMKHKIHSEEKTEIYKYNRFNKKRS